jgi:hypothetical protein
MGSKQRGRTAFSKKLACVGFFELDDTLVVALNDADAKWTREWSNIGKRKLRLAK